MFERSCAQDIPISSQAQQQQQQQQQQRQQQLVEVAIHRCGFQHTQASSPSRTKNLAKFVSSDSLNSRRSVKFHCDTPTNRSPFKSVQMAGSMKQGKTQDDIVYVVAKYDYAAQGNQELDLRKNERYMLLDDSKHWWRVQNSRNQSGYVPSNYVKREKPSLFDSIKKKVKKGSGSKTLPNCSPSRTVDSPTMQRRLPPDPSEAIGTAIVKYNYQAQQPDELALAKGTRILILEKSNDGWWRGQSGNAVGWFPSNYTTEECDNNDEQIHTYAMAENVLDIVVALYSFNSNNDQELTFDKGDRLEIVDRPASDPEWYKARNNNGQIGLVPRNYLQELSEYLSQSYRGCPPTTNDSMDRRNDTMNNSISPPPLNNANNQMERPNLAGKSWYYGAITRSQCDTVLNSHGHDGDFLIRDSETNMGDFSVSLKAPGRNKHFRVHVENGMYCIGQRKFHSLDQLVDHYQRAPIYTNKQGEKLYLVRSLPKANGT
ncbi:cytoplasmic protein NCK1 [Sitodiplosis mosellana]|uniref:cytoplasmic protein NCK1 n=1 Tax=Sitodiplosis mosellana TaxID=263140 RepID=UPI002444D4F7|nr:cytoplasmic protein NCK1 [Sitodiplosis mosellana]XP_055304087.1 cytoplasmic protein NCK1 [Sitodiplosis mosellana]XP_055304088.1 cytoplasmic protein NCK1 [Sitodiplosis mosellana]XP_055304089.1 cytoplasmic protein NCK1 [Sitodiplosis mosellana]XP_055304090.1 cytoplasmic protein NCK1 [Sitodiplosis mosellana]XP_055304091.1 cytoplasmic protein NCK1 [Sitodiplosis mosellana]XP_055304092.1 cytoplasmic protein NCK1 [Sitodiplosis mosellana]XP_055304094.1 cytoplasmic protein NCK1 [Sitodiplosis mosell